MSGGGSGYDQQPSPRIECSLLVFSDILQSPEPTVVKQLKLNERLSVVAETPMGPAIAEHPTLGTAGSIIKNIADLLRCLEEGYQYVATVKGINGLQILVEIRPIPVVKKAKKS